MAELHLRIAGEPLHLLAGRAIYRPASQTLLVADAHWGKAAAFRAGGLGVPGGTTGENLARLEGAVDRTGAKRIVFLGDFLHARAGRTARTLEALFRWRRTRATIEMVLVRGNHDRNAGDPPPELGIRCVDAPLTEGPFALAHHPKPVAGFYTLAGHIHPAVRLAGRGRQREKLPCFWFGERVGVLPAFGSFTGSALVHPAEGDTVCVIAANEVIEITRGRHA